MSCDSDDLFRSVTYDGPYGTNGAVVCDVPEGPCACGAWHHKEKVMAKHGDCRGFAYGDMDVRAYCLRDLTWEFSFHLGNQSMVIPASDVGPFIEMLNGLLHRVRFGEGI